MKERPILFNAPMIRALLDGSKTQTRRIAKTEITMGRNSLLGPRKGAKTAPTFLLPEHTEQARAISPLGQPGDRLWVRETWQRAGGNTGFWYRATDSHVDDGGSPVSHWKPSIFMPRAASRITLEITGVRIERLQDISATDALDEGIKIDIDAKTKEPLMRITGKFPPAKYIKGNGLVIAEYASLWESINGPGSWDSNPWVWAIEFRRVP